MGDQTNFSGSVVIDALWISKTRGVEGLKLQDGFTNLEICEDIAYPFIQGSIFFNDTQGKISDSKIVGGEYLWIEYHSPEFEDDHLFGNFIVTSIEGRVPDGPSKYLMVIKFMSETGYINLHKKIPRLHKGNPVKLIRNILLNDLKVEYTPTLLVNEQPADTDADIQALGDFGEVSYMSSIDESPLEVIKAIASLMVDTSNSNVTGYYFFEGMRSGFELRSYSNLTGETYVDLIGEEDPSEQGIGWDKIFYYDSSTGRDNSGKSFQKMMQQILKLTILTQFDMVPRLMMGALGKKVIEFNVLGKKLVPEYIFDYEEDFPNLATMNQFPLNYHLKEFHPSQLPHQREIQHPVYKVTTHNSFDKAYGNSFVDMSVNKVKTNQVHGMLATNSIDITIPGRTTLDVGTRIWLFVSNQVGASPESGANVIDTALTGWYLITNIKHVISGSAHEMYLRLSSDSYNLGA